MCYWREYRPGFYITVSDIKRNAGIAVAFPELLLYFVVGL